jgi:hypothetical protein
VYIFVWQTKIPNKKKAFCRTRKRPFVEQEKGLLSNKKKAFCRTRKRPFVEQEKNGVWKRLVTSKKVFFLRFVSLFVKTKQQAEQFRQNETTGRTILFRDYNSNHEQQQQQHRIYLTIK